MNAVPPASEREPLDCNVLAADKDGVSCGTGGLDHRLLLTVESDPNDLGRNGQVLAAGSAHQHGIPRLRQGDLLLDHFHSVALNLYGSHLRNTWWSHLTKADRKKLLFVPSLLRADVPHAQ